MDAPERDRIDVLENPATVRAERLSYVDFSLDTETGGDRPAQIGAKAPDACHHLCLSRDCGSDLANDTGDSDLEWSPGVLPFAHKRSQCKARASLHVGPAVVFANSEFVIYQRRNRLTDSEGKGNLRFIGRMDKALDPSLAAYQTSIAGSYEDGEREHGRVERIEDIRLQAGCEPPVAVFQVAKSLKGEEPVLIGDDWVAVKICPDLGARLEVTDFGAGDQRE